LSEARLEIGRKGAGRPLAVKVHTPPLPHGPARQLRLLQIRAALETQRSMSKIAPDRWVAVTDFGEDRKHAALWSVTPFYTNTLQTVLDARLDLPLSAIYVLTASILESLELLRKHAHRPHGALTASNIYIVGGNSLEKASIVLSDLAPLGRNAHAAAGLADNHALGVILATLIRRREHTVGIIEDGPEWTRLGPHAADWREFCNYLLDPHTTASGATLAETRLRFSRLGGRAVRRRVKMAFALTPFLLVALAFGCIRFAPFELIPRSLQEFAISIGNLPPDVEEIPPEFGQVCSAWYEWFGPLCAELDRHDVRTGQKVGDIWLREPALKNIAAIALKERGALDPRILVDDSRNFENLRENPPAAAKKGVVVRRIKAVAAVLAKLAAEVQAWDDTKQRDAVRERLAAAGLATAAADLQLPPLPKLKSGRLAADITRRLLLKDTVERAVKEWDAAEKLLAAHDSTRDPVLAKIRPQAIASLAKTPAASLAPEIAAFGKTIEPRANLLQKNWPQNIAVTLWLKEGFPSKFTGDADDDALARWDAAIADYFRLTPADDPRSAVPWDVRIATLRNEISRYVAEDVRLYGEPTESAQLQTDATALLELTRSLRTRIGIRRDILLLRDQTQEIEKRHARVLAAIADGRRDLNPAPADWLARTLAKKITGSSVLASEWENRRDSLLQDITVEKLADDPLFRSLRAAARKTHDLLDALQGDRFLGTVPALVKPPANLPPEIAERLASVAAAQTDLYLTTLIKQIPWTPDNRAPTVTRDAYAASQKAKDAAAALAKWRTTAPAAAVLFARLRPLLEEGRALDDKELTTVSTAIDNNAAAPSLASEGVLLPPVQALAKMREIGQITDKAALLAHVMRPENDAFRAYAGVALSAWRRLGDLADWPSTLAELDSELAAENALAACYDALRDKRPSSEIAAVKSEITAAARKRWLRGYALIPAAETPALIERLAAFGLNPADLRGLDKFDFLLATAKKTPWATLDNDTATAERDRLLAQSLEALGDVPADNPTRAIATQYLNAIGAAKLSGKQQEFSAAGIGPGRLGWTGKFSENFRRVTYTKTDHRNATLTQEFRLVEPSSGVPFYLSTRAVSLGDFITLVETGTGGVDVLATMPAWFDDVSSGHDFDTRPGPQTWRVIARRHATANRVNDSRMAPNTRWTAFLDPRWPDPLYAPTISAPPPPTHNHPIQNIPPAAARTFAEKLLGARLPTPEEWNALAETFPELALPNAPGANFSDATWLAQRDHLATAATAEKPWPDAGAFTPPETPSGAKAAAYNPNGNDGILWFAEVGTVGNEAPGFTHLFGNIATWTYDPEGKTYGIAGGSAISPANVNPARVYPAEAFSEGFADVGLRPAFDAPPALIQRGLLMSAIRRQPYLRQSAPTAPASPQTTSQPQSQTNKQEK
jgi:hypothetical protein